MTLPPVDRFTGGDVSFLFLKFVEKLSLPFNGSENGLPCLEKSLQKYLKNPKSFLTSLIVLGSFLPKLLLQLYF